MKESHDNILRQNMSHGTGSARESLCRSRWDQPTIDLYSGQVRVCCRVPSLAITREDLSSFKTDAILNNETLVQRRHEMFQGTKHVDCASCWKAEACAQPSPRVGAGEVVEKLRAMDGRFADGHDFSQLEKSHPILRAEAPKFLEIQMGNLCDLKCVYCWRSNSSKWAQEDLEFGKISVEEFAALNRKAPEGFEEIFWQWLETVAPHLEMVSFVGGEPTMQTRFPDILMRVHQICQRQGNSKMRIRIVSNLNCSEKIFARVLEVISLLTREGRAVLLDISMEAFGTRAEFIRFGLKWTSFDQNLERFLAAKLENFQVAISATVNSLSITSMAEFIGYLAEKQTRYDVRFPFMENSVVYPTWLAAEILTPDFSHHLNAVIEELEKYPFESAFAWGYGWARYAQYIQRLQATIRYPGDSSDSRICWTRGRFYRGIRDLEHRRKVNFSAIFPEMRDFLNSCERFHEDWLRDNATAGVEP